MFATVWHAEAFVQESVLDVTLRVRYNTAKVCNMTRFYSERSYRKIVHDNLVLGRTKGTFTSTDRVTGKLLMWEIKLFHKTTYRKLPALLSCREYCSSSSLASVKRKRNIEVNTCNLSVWSRILQYCAKVMQTIIDEKSVCSDLSRFIADVSAKHLMDTINQWDIVLVRLLCMSLQQYLAKQTKDRCSEVRCNDICRSELYFNDLS